MAPQWHCKTDLSDFVTQSNLSESYFLEKKNKAVVISAGKARAELKTRVELLVDLAYTCYQFRCLVNRGIMGVNSLPETVT